MSVKEPWTWTDIICGAGLIALGLCAVAAALLGVGGLLAVAVAP